MAKPDVKSLGGRLRFARIRAGKTQEQVAKRIESHQTTISDWETNEKVPPTDKLVTLCEYLGCTPSWLLGITRPKRDFMQTVRTK